VARYIFIKPRPGGSWLLVVGGWLQVAGEWRKWGCFVFTPDIPLQSMLLAGGGSCRALWIESSSRGEAWRRPEWLGYWIGMRKTWFGGVTGR